MEERQRPQAPSDQSNAWEQEALAAVQAAVRERLGSDFFSEENQALAYFRLALREPRYLAPYVALYNAREGQVNWDAALAPYRYFWLFNGVSGPEDALCWEKVQALIAASVDQRSRRLAQLRLGVRGAQIFQGLLIALPWLWRGDGVYVALVASLFGLLGVAAIHWTCQSVDGFRGGPDSYWTYSPVLGAVMAGQLTWLLWPQPIALTALLVIGLGLLLLCLYADALGAAL